MFRIVVNTSRELYLFVAQSTQGGLVVYDPQDEFTDADEASDWKLSVLLREVGGGNFTVVQEEPPVSARELRDELFFSFVEEEGNAEEEEFHHCP